MPAPRREVPPSVKSWIDDTSIELMSGRRFLVRERPRAGKTWCANALTEELGESAVFVRGKDFTDQNQEALRTRLSDRLHELTESKGWAHLVFDDYHRALQRTEGLQLQRRLLKDLVGSPDSQNIGAIFFARVSSVVHLKARGNLLHVYFDPRRLPTWRLADMEFFGVDEPEETLRGRIGSNAGILGLLAHGGYAAVVDRVTVDAQSIVDDFPGSVRAALTQPEGPTALADDDRHMVRDLAASDGPRERWVDLVGDADLSQRVARAPAWPNTPDASVRECAKLIHGWQVAIWCDRYLPAHPSECEDFLLELRHLTNCAIRLITSDINGLSRVPYADIVRLDGLPGVEVRIMTPPQRNALHERHLVEFGRNSGWAIPLCGRLFGIEPPGNCVALSAPSGFGVDHNEEWQRADAVRRAARR